MRKNEIIQLALIILGTSIIVKVLISILDQIFLLFKFPNDIQGENFWIIIAIVVVLLILLFGIILIIKAKAFSKKILKEERNTESALIVNKNDVLHISIIILCLYFLVTLLPSFLNSIYSIGYSFINEFHTFKSMIPSQLGSISLYIIIVLVFLNSNRFSRWIGKRME